MRPLLQLPGLSAALDSILRDDRIPEQTWKTIDKELTRRLLIAASAAIKPLGTNRYQQLPIRHLSKGK
jgi:hypothetical protein